MKNIIISLLVLSCLLSFSSCKGEQKKQVEEQQDEVAQDEVLEDEITADEVVEEENLQPEYNVIYTPSDETPAVLPEELQVFWDKDTDRYGYQTEDGEIIMPAIFRNATVFFEGLAAVCRELNGPLEYIEASGKTILTVEGIDGANAIDYYGFQPSCIFNDGVAVIYDGGFCIDKNGNILNIKNPEGMYKYGLIAVRDPKTKLIGYADIDGNIVVPGKYSSVRDFEPQGVALVFSEESTVIPPGLESNLRGYINTKGEEIIPLEYYDDPDFRTNYIHPIHREVDGMIELYKDGYYHYFTYDGTLVEKCPDPRLEDNDEPLTYKLVEPTQEELDNMHYSLSILFSHFLKDYDSTKDDAYTKLFCENELLYFYVPQCYDEICEFVSAPLLQDANGKPRWNKSVCENDPLGHFTEIPQEAFDENGVFDEKLYLEYNPSANLTNVGYTVFDADFVEWLVEGVWNGKVDHETIHRFAGYEWLYYYNNSYIASARGMVDETQTTYYSAIEYVKPLGVQKYEVAFNVYHIYNRRRPAYYNATAVIGMKEASNGFRFWSIYSIDYEKTKTDDNDLMPYGIPFGLFYEYGDSVIYPEKDDYSYIRINFDESREISGYYEIEEGVIIDSNGKVYSDMPDSAGTESLNGITQKNSLVLFKEDNEYGYKNADGEIVIEAQFYGASDFSEGLAAVCREADGPLEYINEKGETVIKLEDADGYYNIFTMFPDEPNCDFSDGLAMINGGDFYIDKDGNRIVIENAYGMYNNGLVKVYDPETNLQGYADINGNIVIPCKYVWARDFLPCGVALVFTADYYEPLMDAYHIDMRYCGYVNKKGEEIIPLEFYTPYYVGASGLYPMPYEQNGIIDVYKEGFNYYYRYDGTLLGKKPNMKEVGYGDERYNINLAEYWRWVNDGKPVG